MSTEKPDFGSREYGFRIEREAIRFLLTAVQPIDKGPELSDLEGACYRAVALIESLQTQLKAADELAAAINKIQDWDGTRVGSALESYLRLREPAQAQPSETPKPWKCGADAYSDPPRDCNFPYCGCDPGADRVIEALVEEGWTSADESYKQQRALKNCRLLAARHVRKEPSSDWAHILRFCTEAGVVGDILRDESSTPVQPEPAQAFQARTREWMLACFGPEISRDRVERIQRFIEESIELAQALGGTAADAHTLVDYVFGRPVGEPYQEVGGVLVTLAALCGAVAIDMDRAGEDELARVWTKIDAIREKQRTKPHGSPLPEAPGLRVQVESTIAEVLADHPEPAQEPATCQACRVPGCLNPRCEYKCGAPLPCPIHPEGQGR